MDRKILIVLVFLFIPPAIAFAANPINFLINMNTLNFNVTNNSGFWNISVADSNTLDAYHASYFCPLNASACSGPAETDPKWTSNYSAFNVSWSNTTNNTYDAFVKANVSATANNSLYCYGRSEANLNTNDSVYLNHKTEANLNVNASLYLGGKQGSYFWNTTGGIAFNNITWPANCSANTFINGTGTSWTCFAPPINTTDQMFGACNNNTFVKHSNTSYVLTNNASYILGTNTSYVLTNNASYVLTDNASYVLTNNASYVLTNNASYVLTNNASYVLTNNATYNNKFNTTATSNLNMSTYNVTFNPTGKIVLYNSTGKASCIYANDTYPLIIDTNC